MAAFEGLVYRALNPRYAREPLSGAGAAIYGGRFNAKGVPALYTSLSVMTAIREANQVGTLQPTTLVCYRAFIENVFDATDPRGLVAYGVTPADLASHDWRDAMRREGLAPTQRLAARIMGDAFAAMLAPSFARGAGHEDRNLVIWQWGADRSARLNVIDDDDRLGLRAVEKGSAP
ncbi:MAG: RES family NAD+ phosphorylase [Rubrimonas sp.]